MVRFSYIFWSVLLLDFLKWEVFYSSKCANVFSQSWVLSYFSFNFFCFCHDFSITLFNLFLFFLLTYLVFYLFYYYLMTFYISLLVLYFMCSKSLLYYLISFLCFICFLFQPCGKTLLVIYSLNSSNKVI